MIWFEYRHGLVEENGESMTTELSKLQVLSHSIGTHINPAYFEAA